MYTVSALNAEGNEISSTAGIELLDAAKNRARRYAVDKDYVDFGMVRVEVRDENHALQFAIRTNA